MQDSGNTLYAVARYQKLELILATHHKVFSNKLTRPLIIQGILITNNTPLLMILYAT